MDDLNTLATLLAAPEPSPEAAERSLRRLQRRMRRPARPRHMAWPAAGLGLAAAATAAVLLLPGAVEPTATPNGPPAAAVRLTGGQILLAAATTAARASEGSGAYWYVRTRSDGGDAFESWTARDGRTRVRGEKTAGRTVELGPRTSFRLGGLPVDFDRLEKLPAEPDALTAWIADGVARGDITTSAGRLDAAGQERAVLTGLVSLVSQLPASPEVRAAAFRALAGHPGVESAGAAGGGEALRIPAGDGEPVRLVVDPATSRVRGTTFYVTADGAEVTAERPVTIEARWTDAAGDGG
ncbi:hypothetical protein Sru01_50560 [Sphaerisporangium rufum]|uniref:CU044_5270 family protein n=1 Tax=Sphaerisporangium rufum TaxID=1381558 RepID=A0A919R5V9_9ACTN|nr:CU044_5270 family protein [Sphaerisporangium rufum]GII80074.1 hypothetical protein Sru01_50560 [Sphaerisporangium rufum]